jgi:hypothetical protein
VNNKIFLLKYLGEKHLRDRGDDGRIILKWILKKQIGNCGHDSYGSA